MHICIIMSTPFPPEEGIGNHVYGISAKLIERGHEVTVITRSSSLRSQTDHIDGIDVFRAPFIPVYPFYIHVHGIFINRIFKRLESKFDIVHLHTPLVPLIKTSLPIVTTVHTPMLTDTRFIDVDNLRARIERLMGRFVSYPIELKLLKRADMITTVANSVVQELKAYGLDSNEVRVIENGVDEKIFTPAKNTAESRYILYTGRLGYRKGLFDLVECGKYICERYSDISFVIPGKGLLRGKLLERVKEQGLEGRFKFLGFVEKEELIRLYQNATVYVMPSHYESGPITLLEAMACGAPVISTPVGIAPQLIKNDENGLLVSTNAPEKMAEAVGRLLEDEKLRVKLGINARKTIETGYTWDSVVNKVEKCYQSVI